MYIKKNSRRALLLSVMSLILCCAMLVGTTFAWFTDEVKSGMNTIAAGNLDVELLANGSKVESTTKLFTDLNGETIDKWEPGMVAYENLQVANVGSLALKYQMTLNFGKENDLNGHKLSEVLKVAVLDEPIAGKTRAEVLALAKAAVEADQGNGTLSNFYQTGVLAPKGETMIVENVEVKDKSDEAAVVIYWEPGDNDNWYNANNGQITSDGEPLHIEFGVHLQATQQVNEYDSFGNDYDKLSSILPKATVNSTGAQTVDATIGMGSGSVESIALDTSFQFLPNETAAEAAASEYAGWHADYVISADRAVPANSMALAGYYSAFCDPYNGGNWVAIPVDTDVPANTKVALVEHLGATVNYEMICEFGNDGKGFKCGVADLTGENAGTTITVDLVMYETNPKPHEAHTDINGNACSGNTANCRTGVEKVIGRYTYTFGGSWVNLEDGTELFKDNEGGVTLYDTQNVNEVDYTVPAGVTHLGNYSMSYNTTIENVTLPSSVEDLGRAFDSNGTIKTVVLNEGLETISSRAFKATSALESVEISSTVKTIAADAFQKTGLKEIVIPATVEYVGETAFGASKIEKVTFEGNTRIENKAFRSCKALKTVYINGEDITFVNTTGEGNCWFCNSESNNPNVSNITFYVKNEAVAAKVKTAMGAEAANTPVYVNGVLYNG